MTSFKRLKAKLIHFLSVKNRAQDMRTMAAQKEDGSFNGATTNKSRNFESDYNAATKLLKERMNKNFPDNYYARLKSGENNAYDYGEKRAGAVDTASSAIAMALRNGATVQEAAAAGAASVGI